MASTVYGAISASLGSTGGPYHLDIDLCVRAADASSYSFLTAQYVRYSVSGDFNPVTATSSATLQAGTYYIGMCARSASGSQSLTGNEWVNGWISVTPA